MHSTCNNGRRLRVRNGLQRLLIAARRRSLQAMFAQVSTLEVWWSGAGSDRRDTTTTNGLSQAVLTGLEPATSTLTGWRANQLLYRTIGAGQLADGAPNGIRTRAPALKGRCPRPLDDAG